MMLSSDSDENVEHEILEEQRRKLRVKMRKYRRRLSEKRKIGTLNSDEENVFGDGDAPRTGTDSQIFAEDYFSPSSSLMSTSLKMATSSTTGDLGSVSAVKVLKHTNLVESNVPGSSRNKSGTLNVLATDLHSDGNMSFLHYSTLNDGNIKFPSDSDKDCLSDLSILDEHDDTEHSFDSDHDMPTLWDDMRKTVVETGMTEIQINRILKDLRNHGIESLPLDSRTLLRGIDVDHSRIKRLSGMECFNFGYKNQIRYSLSRYSQTSLNQIDLLDIKDNIDGLPLFKSSGVSAWPLLAKIDNLKPILVFPVLITVGSTKPTDLQFLDDAIEEMRDMVDNGLSYEGRHFQVKFTHVCDTPARHMVKNIVSFNGYYGCDYCEMRGTYDSKRMTWPSNSIGPSRSDQSFREQLQKEHHKGASPFERVACDMINTFPYDFMHLGSGVMLKLLSWVTSGPRTVGSERVVCRMTAHNINILNERLLSIRNSIPNCFARLPRGMKDLQRFKATEFRQLLLYTSKIVLKDLMASKAHYENLIELNVGCGLLSDPTKASRDNDYANELLTRFVGNAKTLYGNAFMVYNIHSLLHLAQTAKHHGCLDAVSAYAFESKLGKLKRCVRSPLRPLVSLVKRVTIEQEAEIESVNIPVPSVHVKFPNNIYVDIQAHQCFEALSIEEEKVIIKRYVTVQPYFRKPCSSFRIGCYQVDTRKFIYDSVAPSYLLSIRRGIKIDLSELFGIESENLAVFMGMFHEDHIACI